MLKRFMLFVTDTEIQIFVKEERRFLPQVDHKTAAHLNNQLRLETNAMLLTAFVFPLACSFTSFIGLA